MSRDEAREHIRAAQEAEIAGNREGAVRHLERAALAYVRVGLHAKAAQMYRNCLRLAPERGDLKDSLEKAEAWAAKRSEVTADGPPAVSSEGFDALAIPRGPQRVMPGLEAWCSFCCRPTTEVGELVAGPAGAFICASCVSVSAGMLEVAAEPVVPAAESRPEPKTEPVREQVSAPRTTEWLGPEPVLMAARSALSGRGPSLVVLGPEGCGKSALLDVLAGEGKFPRVDLAEANPTLPANGAVLVEHLDLASPATRAQLARCAFVATWRAEVEVEPLRVSVGESEIALFSASGFALPSELDAAAIALPAPDAELLQKILERDLAEHDGPILVGAASQALVARALASGRSAKALVAELGLLRSLAPGVPVSVPAPPKKARRKRS